MEAQLAKVNSFLSWNGFPFRVANSLVARFSISSSNKRPTPDHAHEKEPPGSTIWINMPFIGQKGEQLTKACVGKFRRCLENSLFIPVPNIELL